MVRTDAGATLRSTDGGRTFATAPSEHRVPARQRGDHRNRALGDRPGGTVVHVANVTQSTAAVPDPGSPDLGAGADLIASPAALPGVVVAVSTDGTVWRRGQDGDWKQALLLLPASLVQGVPRITSVTAFTEPLSDAIYLGTDGYAVLISTDGGDDWIRAGPGLPDSRVLALGRLRRASACMRARPTASGSTCSSACRRPRHTPMRSSSGGGSGSAQSRWWHPPPRCSA